MNNNTGRNIPHQRSTSHIIIVNGED